MASRLARDAIIEACADSSHRSIDIARFSRCGGKTFSANSQNTTGTPMANKKIIEPVPMPTDGRRWTPEQWLGITTVGQSLLVSAAAGSGKTAMLAERCAYLVCDAPEPCSVDELLVVTFTEAAAAEMKSRISLTLRERAERQPNGRASHQLKLIDSAHVSTLHSFCARVLRQHFHLVGLDPGFSVLDGEEAKLLRRETARELFSDRYELDEAGEFQRFVDAYGDGDDERLARLLVRAHEMLTSLFSPADWIANALARIEQAVRLPLDESGLGQELHDSIARELAALNERCDRGIALLTQLGGFPKYIAILQESKQIIGHWTKVFRAAGLSGLKEESEITFDRLPPVASTVPNKALAKATIDGVREAMKAGPWRDLLRFGPEEWIDGLRGILPHANVFLTLIGQFQTRYRAAKDASRVLDFADLERYTLDVLCGSQSPSATARSFHQQFKFVLVDEYQDINEVQDAILKLVSRECVCDGRGERANLFCVGDVKQSIYRFRLAEAGRFLDRQEQFRADGGRQVGSVIDLQKNFRSRERLLDAINGVFARLMTSDAVQIAYGDTHKLHAGAEYPPGDGICTFAGSPIEMHLLPAKFRSTSDESDTRADCEDDEDLDRTEREAVLVAKRIREMMGLDGTPPMCVTEKDTAGVAATIPMRFRHAVILLRSMRYKADQYAEVLRLHGIPVHSESGTGYFESTEVNDVLSLLSLLNNSRQDIPLAAVLRGPLGGLSEPENSLARIRLVYPRDVAPGFDEAAFAYANDMDDSLAAQLKQFLARLGHWRELSQRRPLAEVIRRIYDDTEYLAYCSGLLGGEQRVANLLYLLERAEQFGTFHRQGLARFMEFVDELRSESDLGQPSIASESEDVVRIMSVHRSKGLEFPVVFLPDLGKSINFSDCQGTILLDRRAGLGMSVIDEYKRVRYPSLASVVVRNELRRQTLAEEMRVLYVAMTRAKEHLVLIGTGSPDFEEQCRANWAGHIGTFPTDLVLGASNMLGWLGPAAVAGEAENIIQMHTHDEEEVSNWRIEAKRRAMLTPLQERLARLELLDPPPARNADADTLITRLRATYPHAAFARLHATESVTAQLQRHVASLTQPRFVLEQGDKTAVDAGNTTHLVLQHLDFRRPCDEADLASQISELVQRKIVAPAQAKNVDVPSLEWLMSSTAGALLRRHTDLIRRELPVYFADRPLDSNDPLDQVMIRGRVDVLIPLADGNIVIDYKTDNISPDAVARRATEYEKQISGYCKAVEAITGNPVKQFLVVFLRSQLVHDASQTGRNAPAT
jgi:ATP-dependent helicase/nuclease subunit A